MDAGGDTFPQGEDAETISETLRNYCRPDTIDYVYQQITKFLRYKRTDQTAERRRLDFDVLRHDAEARVITGGSFLDRSVSIFCAQDAGPSRNEKPLFLASSHWASDFPFAAEPMRRPLEACDGPARQDVLAAADCVMESE